MTVRTTQALDRESALTHALPGARQSLVLLLLINLFNYIDRQVLAAVESQIQGDLFADQPGSLGKMGMLQTAFLVSYMLAAPIFGFMADRMSRWLLVGIGVILWSLASGASGLASTFMILLITRCFIGVGEAGYGPAAPTLLADLYPVSRRGYVMAWFYLALPVGAALGYMLGGFIAARWGWRVAFYAVVPPGVALGIWALLMKDPPRGHADSLGVPARKATWRDYLVLLKTPSYILDTAGMAAMTFAIGGISFWMPRYLLSREAGDIARVNLVFGIIIVVAGISATLLGGLAGDALRRRFPGSYFLVSGVAIIACCPFILLMLVAPFPFAWALIFLAVFFLFFNTGPSNTILANVTHPSVRATAFALNIFIIHALGDAISPPLLGRIVGPVGTGNGLVYRWNLAFFVVAVVTAIGGIFWLWGSAYLERDTRLAPARLDEERGFAVIDR